jgi:transposase
VRAFEFFGGVVKIVVPDNLKTGITKPNYYEPGVNNAYQELAEHYKFAVLPARVSKPRDKGKVENGVLNVERRIIAPLRHRTFFSVHEAEKAVKEQLDAPAVRSLKRLTSPIYSHYQNTSMSMSRQRQLKSTLTTISSLKNTSIQCPIASFIRE